MRRLTCLIVLSTSMLALLSSGCDREEPKPAAPVPSAGAPPSAADAAKVPGDSHPRVASDLLAAAKEFNATLSAINSDAEAKAAEPKLRELAERHEALAARSNALPPPTPDTDRSIRDTVQAPLQAEARSIADHIERFKPVGSITRLVTPYVDRIGQASQVVAVTSHVKGRPSGVDDPGSPESLARAAEVRELHKDVPIPAPLRTASLGARYAVNAAPLVREFGAKRVAAVKFGQVSTTDRAFIPLIAAAATSLKLKSSLPTVAVIGRTMTDVYVAVAPVDDVNDLATRLKNAIPDARTSVEAADQVVYVATESSTAAQNKRAARLSELGASQSGP